MALPLMVSVDAESIDLEFPFLLMYLPVGWYDSSGRFVADLSPVPFNIDGSVVSDRNYLMTIRGVTGSPADHCC